MNREEINKFIEDKQIPLSFMWEDNEEYFFWIWTGQWSTISDNQHDVDIFPFGEEDFDYPEIKFEQSNRSTKVYCKEIIDFNSDSFKTILTDFMFWWEINKGRCKTITYYQK